MDKANLEYIGGVIVATWTAFVTAPFVAKSIVFVGSFLLSLWLDLYVFILGIPLIAVMDAHLAIKACIKKGGEYESHLLKKGLLQKFKLYLTFMILTVILDIIFHKIYNYEIYFTTYLLFAFVALYEAGSIVESMNVLHPKNKAVKKFASILNLTEKKLNDKIE